MPGLLTTTLSSLVLLLTAACAGEGAAGPGDRVGAAADRPGGRSDAVTSMPAIYVDSHVEFFSNDINLVREGYLRNLDACRQSDLPIRELPDDEVAKLGTARLQRWFRSDSFAYRWERWRFHTVSSGQAGMCQFMLSTSGAHHYVTPDTHRAMNLETGKAFSDPGPYRDYFPRRPVDKTSDSSVVRAEAMKAIHVPEKDRQVAGQPCEHFAVGQVDACDWSGGEEWGFSTSPSGLVPDSVRGLFFHITLEQEPVGGSGMRLTTNTFQIDAGFAESEMLPEAAP